MSATPRPNILFFFPDQHRPDFVPWREGVPVRMPTLERLAARGVVFDNCFTPSPLCAPARACLATGKAYGRTGVQDNGQPLPADQPTYYQRLRDAGYEVAGCGKFDLDKPTLEWNLDGSRKIREWGFTRGIDSEGKWDAIRSVEQSGAPQGPYMQMLKERGLLETHIRDFTESNGGRRGHFATHATALPDDAYSDTWIGSNALALLDAIPAGTPWHLVLNFTGPHNPWDVTGRMLEGWREVDFPPPHDSDEADPETHRRVRQNYAAMLENIDRQMGRVLDAVEARGELENTLVIFSSDHGENLGDHNRWGKSTPDDASARVPLVVAGPGVRAGRRTDALVELQDLAATILDAAGCEPLAETDGRSLLPLLAGEAEEHRDVIMSGMRYAPDKGWFLLADKRWKLIRRLDGTPDRLHDREADPWDDADVAAAHPGVAQEFADRLESALDGAAWPA